uniref:Uncharacterized protein n=1 Tax=Meloidogyne incognita TaxID=6306 RepID=A0A914KV21_MELIC
MCQYARFFQLSGRVHQLSHIPEPLIWIGLPSNQPHRGHAQWLDKASDNSK